MNKPIKIYKTIYVKVSDEDYQKIIIALKNTTCRSISEYGRKIMTGKPITVYYRNKSFDEFTEAAIQWKKDLESILVTANLSDSDKEWLTREIITIKGLLSKIYDNARQNKDFR